MEESYSSTNVVREKTNGLTNIKNAGLFARFVAVIVDLAIASLLFFGLLIFTQRVICVNSPYVKKAQDAYYGYNIDSGLYEESDQNGLYKEKTFDSFKGYEDLFYSYYSDYLVNKCPEEYRVNYNVNGVDYSAYWFNVYVLGQNDDLGLYQNLDKRDELVRVTGVELFTYKLDGENKPIYNEIALPRCVNNNPDAEIGEEDQTKLTRYFYISDADNKEGKTCYYHIITIDLNSREFVAKAYNEWYLHYYSLPMLFCLSFAMIIFFGVIPLILKNGATLGKLIFHLGLVNNLGYRVSKLQVVLRFGFMFLIIEVFYCIFNFILGGALLWLLGILTFLALASYGLAIFTKEHKAIHDFIAGTIVVDVVHSEIYKDATQEAKVKEEINAVKSIIPDVETPRDESILFVNKNFDKEEKDPNSDNIDK